MAYLVEEYSQHRLYEQHDDSYDYTSMEKCAFEERRRIFKSSHRKPKNQCENLDDGSLDDKCDHDRDIRRWSRQKRVHSKLRPRQGRKSGGQTHCIPPGLRTIPPTKSQKNLRYKIPQKAAHMVSRCNGWILLPPQNLFYSQTEAVRETNRAYSCQMRLPMIRKAVGGQKR